MIFGIDNGIVTMAKPGGPPRLPNLLKIFIIVIGDQQAADHCVDRGFHDSGIGKAM
jgi:hypothetical protein